MDCSVFHLQRYIKKKIKECNGTTFSNSQVLQTVRYNISLYE